MSNKLDDRYVEYDLANSINILPVEHGGTGINNLINADRILISQATGVPASPLKINTSSWSIDSLGALTSWDPNKGAFEARIQNTEAHVLDSGIHVPPGGTNLTFLRGDNTWHTISLILTGIDDSDNGLILAAGGYLVDTSYSDFSVSLPANPGYGDTIKIIDKYSSFEENHLTIFRNGNRVDNEEEDIICNVDDFNFDLVFIDSTFGWKIVF